MKCTKCGAQLKDGAMFCVVCGARCENESNGNQPLPTAPQEPKNNNLLYIMIAVILAVAAIVSAIIISLGSDDSEPSPTESIATPTPIVELATPAPEVQTPVMTEESIVSVMYVVKCNEYITLRTSPSTSAAEIIKIPLGASVGYISDADNGFYKVSYNGQRGYALAAYLSSAPEKALSNSMRVVNCDEWISLRKTPSTDATRITTIPLGAIVEFLGMAENGFYKIRYNGYVGYALASYLQ